MKYLVILVLASAFGTIGGSVASWNNKTPIENIEFVDPIYITVTTDRTAE